MGRRGTRIVSAEQIAAKSAGCNAPVRGHQSLAATLACPYHGPRAGNSSRWIRRGIDVVPPAGGMPAHSGAQPKVGHHNIGMELTEARVERFLNESSAAGVPVMLDHCRIKPNSSASDRRIFLFADSCRVPVELRECTFASLAMVSGPTVTIRGGKSATELRVSGGAHLTEFEVIATQLIIERNAQATELRVQANGGHFRSVIWVQNGGRLVDPVWVPRADKITNDAIVAADELPLIIASQGADISLSQPGWPVQLMSDSARESVDCDPETTFVFAGKATPTDLVVERGMATTPDATREGGSYIAAHNEAAWFFYTDIRGAAPTVNVDRDLVDLALAVSKN